MLPCLYGLLWFCAFGCGRITDAQVDDGKRYICRAVALSGDASCPVTLLPELSSGSQEEELRNTVMQLRETILQQKENISKQQGAINELTKKLSLCAAAADDKKYNKGSSWGKERQNTMGDVPRDPNDSIESLGKTMQGLKDRLENLEQQQMRANMSGASFPTELRDLLQRRLGDLEKQLLKKVSNLEEEKSVAQLPLDVRDGKWHHICITWTTRDGQWEAYQDGFKRGNGDNLAAWHPIKAGGVIILGQEQDVVGGHFDAGQAFVGELSQVNIWDRVLKPAEIQSMANCSTYIPGNVVSWLATNVEVFGRGAFKRPLEMCQDRL
ncbi:unnamed protein product, partial [Tetraodon nigroviridis]